MEEGEQPKEALLRELTEEMGFVPDIERIYPFDVYQSKDKHFKYYSFVCVVNDEFTPVLNQESCGYCWVDLGLLTMDSFQMMVLLISEVLELLVAGEEIVIFHTII